MMDKTIEVRIGRYLSGEADHDERRVLELEMKSNPVLLDQFEAYQRIWQVSQSPAPAIWDVEGAWNRFSQQQITGQQPVSHYRLKKLSWAMAAMLVLALGASIFLWSRPSATTYAYDPENNQPIELSDGSVVYLNKNASIEVHPFGKKKRFVELKGEAYFDVQPDASKPFIVSAGSSLTEVVGTAFNLHESTQSVSIFVSKGKVIFSSGKEPTNAVALTSGEAARLENGSVRRIVNPSPNMHAWHSKELSFFNMPLSSVIEDVAAYFNQEITIENESIKSCRIYIPLFREPEIKSVLTAVAVFVNGDLAIEGEKCIIRGGSCVD